MIFIQAQKPFQKNKRNNFENAVEILTPNEAKNRYNFSSVNIKNKSSLKV